MKKRIKKLACAIAVACGCLAIGGVVSAGTISFTITINGANADTKSRREIKTADGDYYAYFTLVQYDSGYSPSSVLSRHLTNANIFTPTVYFNRNTIGITQRSIYDIPAPGGEYYYMQASQNPLFAETTFSGRYCP